MIRTNRKVSIILAFLVTIFSTFVLHSTSFAHETPRIPGYTVCSRTIQVLQVTLRDNSHTGVNLTGQLYSLMDSHDTSTYCGELVVKSNVVTTHTGVLTAIFTPPNATQGNKCRTFNNCAITGKNNFTLYNTQYVSGGTNQCTDVQFFDDNGPMSGVYPCWITPSMKHHR